MRSVDTAVEGHRAVRPRVDVASTVRESPIDPRRKADANIPTVREMRPVTPQDLEGHGSPTAVEAFEVVRPVEHDDPSTVEGLTPVEPEVTAPMDLADAGASAELPAAQAAEARSRVPVWGALWVASLLAVAMSVWFYARTDDLEDDETSAEDVRSAQPEILSVPAGSFRQGLDESVRSFILMACLNQSGDSARCDQDTLLAGEFPEEVVELAPYRIDMLEVTVEQWDRCVKEGACPPADLKECAVYTHQGLQVGRRVPRILRDPDRPVSCITREEAARYCDHVGGRLPKPSEWERAARGTDGRLFPWGIGWDPTLANWGEVDIGKVSVVGKLDGFEWASPPGSFPEGSSPVGALDMAGNVAEWVASDDPLRAVARGGSWASNPFELRVTGRLQLDSDARRADVGFRCAYDDRR